MRPVWSFKITGHTRWAISHAILFFRYWGHAARYTEFDRRPIQKVAGFRDFDWLQVHPGTRRRLGYWSDAVRFIQLAWERTSRLGNWIPQARDREDWKLFTGEWIALQFPHPTGFFVDLSDVELLGRSLLQVGDKFWLLPFRHVPVESPYPSPYTFVPAPDDTTNQACCRISSDGSAHNYEGGGGLAILPPYGRIPEDLVLVSIPISGRCTNIRAELVAATTGLSLAYRILRDAPGISIEFHSDSMHVLQVLADGIITTSNIAEVSQLRQAWARVEFSVVARHVRAHKGDPLNELADSAAKYAVKMRPRKQLYRSWDFTLARFTELSEPPLSLLPWW